jgi:hypothetical protein
MKAFISAFRSVNSLENNLVQNMSMFKDLISLGANFEQILGVYTDKNNVTSEELSFMIQLDSSFTSSEVLRLGEKYIQESVLLVSQEPMQFNLSSLHYMNDTVEVLGTMRTSYNKPHMTVQAYSYVPSRGLYLTVE